MKHDLRNLREWFKRMRFLIKFYESEVSLLIVILILVGVIVW